MNKNSVKVFDAKKFEKECSNLFMFCIILDLSTLFHAELALFCIILEKFKGKYNAVIIM